MAAGPATGRIQAARWPIRGLGLGPEDFSRGEACR